MIEMAIEIKDMNIKEATQYWGRGFNAIPQMFITNALGDRLYDEFVELYPSLKVCSHCGHEFTEEQYNEMTKNAEEEGSEVTCLHCDSHEDEIVDYDEYSMNNRDYLPMWGTMWTFEESLDEIWAEENIDIMYQCGFRVYEHEDLGIVIGIDGAGYDFYESHWIPLYKARGLRWHKEENKAE
jgi:hypothetical protein